MINIIYKYAFFIGAVFLGLLIVLGILLVVLVCALRKRNSGLDGGTQKTKKSLRNKVPQNTINAEMLVDDWASAIDDGMMTQKISDGEFFPEDITAETISFEDDYLNKTATLNDQPAGDEFVIEYEITYIHTREIIS